MIVRLVIALVCAFFWSCVSSRAGDAENRDAVREAKAEQYRQKRSIIQEKLKSDSAFLQLVDAYERKMILGDAFIEPDSGYSFSIAGKRNRIPSAKRSSLIMML